jgi:hypothetical protein
LRARHGIEVNVIFDASLGFVGAHKIEREAPSDSHVFHAMAGSTAGQIIFEHDVEQPVRAFDAPMAACPAGDTLDVERHGGDIEAGVKAAAIGIFGAQVELEQGLDGGEAGLAWIAAIGCDPIELVGGGIDPRLDAAVLLFDGRFADEFGSRSGAEIILDIGFQRCSVALEGE